MLIACDWQKEIGGDGPKAGYIGFGLSKFAFKVRHSAVAVLIFLEY